MYPKDYLSIEKHVEFVYALPCESITSQLHGRVDRDSKLEMIRATLEERRMLVLVGQGSSKKQAI